MTNQILHLNLKKKWFDMIESGEKKEEYREVKPYFDRIFSEGKIKIKGKYYYTGEVTICFSNGYSKNRRQMFFSIQGLTIREGKEEWGAEPNKKYYCIHLKEKLR